MKRSTTVTVDELEQFDAIIDARSPGEFAEDRIPGALSCPVLSNEERIEIGTLYKQASPFEAKKRGAAYVSRNIATHLLARFQDQSRQWRPLVYCWRGGQRSGAFVTVLRQIGWDAHQLEGGYKAYRRLVVEALAGAPPGLSFTVIGGPTGSAKTRLLHALAEQGAQVLDLEGIACHKGSVLGRHPDESQPSQKWFESQILQQLRQFSPQRPVFVEAESRKIGALQVPDGLIEAMRSSPCIHVDAPLEERVRFLLADYPHFAERPEFLFERLNALRPLRGNEKVDAWQTLAQTQQWGAFVAKLLTEHYDPLYRASQERNYSEHPAQTLHLTNLTGDGLQNAATELLAQCRRCKETTAK